MYLERLPVPAVFPAKPQFRTITPGTTFFFTDSKTDISAVAAAAFIVV